MGNKNSKDSARCREVVIEKPFSMRKYPVTNIEFYRFIKETGYKTEAESTINAIVYNHGHDPNADSQQSAKNVYSNPTLAPDETASWIGEFLRLYRRYLFKAR